MNAQAALISKPPPASKTPALRELPQAGLGRTTVASCTLLEAADHLIAAARERQEARLVVTANLQHLRMLRSDRGFRSAYDKAYLRVADGAPLLRLARLAGNEIPERVAGSDLVPELCRRAATEGLTVLFVGGAHGVSERASAVARRDYPGIKTARSLCPPWGFHLDPAQNTLLVDQINASGADLVFMCLGAPKQEKWVAEHLDRLAPGIYVGAGATVDFIAGTIPRAPELWQRFGLEWLHRMMADPRRLVLRYLRDALAVPGLMLAALRCRVSLPGRRARTSAHLAQA